MRRRTIPGLSSPSKTAARRQARSRDEQPPGPSASRLRLPALTAFDFSVKATGGNNNVSEDNKQHGLGGSSKTLSGTPNERMDRFPGPTRMEADDRARTNQPQVR